MLDFEVANARSIQGRKILYKVEESELNKELSSKLEISKLYDPRDVHSRKPGLSLKG